MKKAKLIHLVIILLLSLSQLHAAEAKWDIKGQLIEQETNENIPYVNISLFNKSDSSLVSGCISNFDGEFSLEKIEEGQYYILISFVGFEDITIDDLDFSSASKSIDLGTIAMQTDVAMLQEVAVTAKTSQINNTIDKQVINVDKSILANGGTAVDLVKLSPSVSLSGEGNVKLRGSTKFIVLINGKPTTLSADEVLRQTPANIISKIEIITSPSVKYNAEGGAGIINIVLKKNADGSFNGMANLTVGSRDKYAGDLTFNYNKEKISLSAGIDWRDYTKTATNNYYRVLHKGDETNYAFLGQNRISNDNNLALHFGLDYNPTKKDNLSYSLHTGYTQKEIDINEPSDNYSIDDGIHSYRANTFYFKQKPRFITNNLSYNRKLDDKGSNLSFNTYYSYIDYYLLTSQSMQDADENFNPIDSNPFLQDILNTNYSNDLRIDADYTQILNKKNTLELGGSYHQYDRYINVKYSQYDFLEEEWEDIDAYTNKYSYNENVYSAYANLNTDLWGIQTSIGLRTEYMDRALQREKSDEKYLFDRLNFFPGFSFSKTINEKHSMKLANSNRINRPDEYMMNPFPEFEDQVFFSLGNPFLIPEIIRSTELMYQYSGKKLSYSGSFYYRTTQDKIEQKLWIREDEKVGVTFHNDASDVTVGLELMANIDLKDWWSLNANTNVYHYSTEGNVEGEFFSRSAYSWNAQLVNSFDLWKNSSAQLIAYYNSKTVRTQGELSDYYFLDFGLKQTFLEGKLSVNFQWKDILQSLNYELETETGNMNILGEFKNESPIFLLTVSYQISKYKKNTKAVHTDFDM